MREPRHTGRLGCLCRGSHISRPVQLNFFALRMKNERGVDLFPQQVTHLWFPPRGSLLSEGPHHAVLRYAYEATGANRAPTASRIMRWARSTRKRSSKQFRACMRRPSGIRAHCPLWSRGRPERPQQERCRGNPETDDHRRCHSADRALGSSPRLRAELRHERTRGSS